MKRGAAQLMRRVRIRVISASALAAMRATCRVVVDPHHPSSLLSTDNCFKGRR
jgi:hypothetical protein